MPIWRGTTSTDWGTATNWDTNTVPANNTDAIFDASAVNNCVLGGNRVCRDLIFNGFPTAYTVNIGTFNLDVYKNVTLQSNISSRVTGTTGTLRMALTTGGTAASGTLTSNGGTWPLNFSGNAASITITLADNFNCSGSATILGTTVYINNTFSISGSFTTSGPGTLNSNTTNFIMTGTGNLSLSGGCNVELNTSGAITVIANITTSRRFIITNVGTLNGLQNFNFTFQPTAATNILDFGLGNRSVQDFSTNTGSNPLTILSSFTCRDFALIGAAYNGPTSPSTAIITITRNYNNTGTVSATNGTLSLVMNAASGAGSIANTAIITRLPLTINAGANNITLGAAFSIGTGASLTRTSGNIVTGTSTATIANGASVTINNMIFWNVTSNGGITMTQNTANTINGTLLLNASNTFAGTAGWTCATLINTTNNSTITLQNSVTYRTTTGVQLVSSLSTQPITMQSVNPSVRAIWTLDYGATQNIIYVNGTRIDSSLGQTIWTFGGLISTTPVGAETLNWRTGTRPGTIAYVFLN